ncbi:hypothetical protein AAFN60_11510 [Roseibacillus persicicus]|uniref:hypothetical protein n=1 Tax=Roseibacillus persicicus TaxID=454148 RepID=UPI00398B8327
MFSQKEFIAASRQFVCVRLESYESEEHQKMVRKFLGGSFANTAFAILAPDGETQLSRSGRSPHVLLGRRGRPEDAAPAEVIQELTRIAANYQPKGNASEATLPDFHTTRQALNVAAGDQRLLVLTVASGRSLLMAKTTLRTVLNDSELIGRFHHDFAEKESAPEWTKLLEGEKETSGFLVIAPDSFGLKGKVVAQLPLTASVERLKNTLIAKNKIYSNETERTNYSEHVREGRQKKVYFPNAMPYGEDRDGDGVIDKRPERGPRR